MSEILVKEYRGNIVENAHRGSIAVVSSTGDTIAYLGDIEKQTFMRPASKPIQVLPTLLAGLHRRFNLTDEDVAMFNSSHWGSNHHIFVLEEISRKTGLNPDDMIMKPCASTSASALAAKLTDRSKLHPRQGQSKLQHCCSGKHFSLMLLQRELTGKPDGYQLKDSPVQQQIINFISMLSQTPTFKIGLGIDGCGVPVFALPLRSIAMSYAKLMDPFSLSNELRETIDYNFSCIHKYPEKINDYGTPSYYINQNPDLIMKDGSRGVICMAMGRAMELDPFWIGGAILSGIYFGDRCSPVSSSANLVCVLTKTDIYENIREMVKTSLVPFVATCILYYIVGRSMSAGNGRMDVEGLFSNRFVLHWSAVIPAAIILVLSVFRVEVKKTMLISIVLAAFLSVVLQGRTIEEILQMCLTGYQASDPALNAMMNGGGLKSMIKVAAIVSLSSCYAGIFEGTGLLKPIQGKIEALSRKITPFGATFAVAAVASMIACNQTLSIMLTHQLCKEGNPDNKRFAIDLENTAVVLAPLVPWSIAGAVPLAAVGAPIASVVVASYLYILPIWSFLVRLIRRS